MLWQMLLPDLSKVADVNTTLYYMVSHILSISMVDFFLLPLVADGMATLVFADCMADVIAIWWQMEWPLMSGATYVADVIACGIDGIAT